MQGRRLGPEDKSIYGSSQPSSPTRPSSMKLQPKTSLSLFQNCRLLLEACFSKTGWLNCQDKQPSPLTVTCPGRGRVSMTWKTSSDSRLWTALLNRQNDRGAEDHTEDFPGLQTKILSPFLSEKSSTLGTTSTSEGQGHLQRQLVRDREGALWTTEVGNTWRPVPVSGLPAGGEGDGK